MIEMPSVLPEAPLKEKLEVKERINSQYDKEKWRRLCQKLRDFNKLLEDGE